MKKTILLISIIVCASTLHAAEKINPARPASFNKNTAMLAIYGSYNEQHQGTLVPLKNTKTWNMKDAEVLCTPILVSTYTEAGIKNGVIAIQRQTILEGEIVDSHATAAEISVYVFAFNGTEYVFKKGKQKVTEAGAHGSAPDGKLIKIGADRFGLLFEGGDIHQGITNDYAFIISLSAPVPTVVMEIETGETGEDWGWDAKFDFLEDTGSDYYPLKLTTKGTKKEYDQDENLPVNNVEYYAYMDGKYQTVSDKKFADLKAVHPDAAYHVGDAAETRETTMPTIPRKLLR